LHQSTVEGENTHSGILASTLEYKNCILY
jgi:hypothetical protein